MQCNIIPYNTIQYAIQYEMYTVQCKTRQCNAIQYNIIQNYSARQGNAIQMQCNTICNTMKSNTRQCNAIQSIVQCNAT